jgi:membrane-associated progesterone receptor component
MSKEPADVRPDWYDLDEKEKKTLADWFTFFSKRYNIIGTVEGATNKEPEGSSSA